MHSYYKVRMFTRILAYQKKWYFRSNWYGIMLSKSNQVKITFRWYNLFVDLQILSVIVKIYNQWKGHHHTFAFKSVVFLKALYYFFSFFQIID